MEKEKIDIKIIEEIKKKTKYTDEGDESLADYTYDYLYKKKDNNYYKEDYRDS